MKKIILFVLLGVTIFSCKKKSSGSPAIPINTIIATIDDTVYTFNQNIQDTTAALYSDSVIYLGASDPNSDQAVIVLRSDSAFATRTYNADTSFDYAAVFDITFSSSNYESTIPQLNNPLTVIVTAITDTSIQGTFSGNIYLNGDTTKALKVVTDGKFNFRK
jgi:hypothetical protein